MRVFPKSAKRPLLLILVGLVLITWRIVSIMPGRHLYDLAGIIPQEQELPFDLNFSVLRDRAGVDARIVLIRDSSIEDLERYALDVSRRGGLGNKESGQGLLIVLNYATRKMRMEVGPHLQGVFTDAYVGYLLRSHLDLFTDPARAEFGLRTLFHLLNHQALVAIAGDEWSPVELEHLRDSTRLANGGGATTAMSGARVEVGRLPEAVRARLGPQPSPQGLLEAYRAWLLLDPIDMTVDLFTPASLNALKGTPYTRPMQDIDWYESDREFVIVERDSLALAYATDSPVAQPFLLRRVKDRWQVDVVAHWSHLVLGLQGDYSWGWVSRDDEWDAAFGDLFYDVGDDLKRLRDGNNTPLRFRASRWE